MGLDSASIVNHNLCAMCLWSLLCTADPLTMHFQLRVLPLSSFKIRSEKGFGKQPAFSQLALQEYPHAATEAYKSML